MRNLDRAITREFTNYIPSTPAAEALHACSCASMSIVATAWQGEAVQYFRRAFIVAAYIVSVCQTSGGRLDGILQ